MTDTQTSPIMQELNELQAYFQNAKTLLSQNQVVDMVGMDARITQLCQRVQAAPPQDQQAFLPEMTILIELLNSYEQELRQIQSNMPPKTDAQS